MLSGRRAPMPVAASAASSTACLGSGSRVHTPVRSAAAPLQAPARFCAAAPPPSLAHAVRAKAAPPVMYLQPSLSASSSAASLRSRSQSQEPQLRASTSLQSLTPYSSFFLSPDAEPSVRQAVPGQLQSHVGLGLGAEVKLAEYPQVLHTPAARATEAQAKRACGFAERSAWDGRPAAPGTPSADAQKRAESAGAIARILLAGGPRGMTSTSGPAAAPAIAPTVARMQSTDKESPRSSAPRSPREGSPQVTGRGKFRNFVPGGLRGNSPGRRIGGERGGDRLRSPRSPRSQSGSPGSQVRSPREVANTRLAANGSVRLQGNKFQYTDSHETQDSSPRRNVPCSSPRRELRADFLNDSSVRLPSDSSETLNDSSVLNWYQVSVWEQASVEELVSEQATQIQALQALSGQNPWETDARDEDSHLQRAVEENWVRTVHFMETGEGRSLLADRAREHMEQDQSLPQAAAVKRAHEDLLQASESKARSQVSEAVRQREARERRHAQRLTIARLQVLRELIRLQSRYEDLISHHGISRSVLRGFDAGYVDRVKQEIWYREARQIAERQVLAKAEAVAETLADRSRLKGLSSPRSPRRA